MKKIGIVAKINNPKSPQVVKELYTWLKKRHVSVFLETQTAQLIDQESIYTKKDIPSKVDMIVVLGGDGTLLSVARNIKHHRIPILGINLGFLGFLTELTIDEMYPALEKVLKQDFEIERRMTLFVQVIRDNNPLESHIVLNDAVISKGELARILNLEISINGQFATRYRSDGLIISTPTGSTAYSLAAGGPILYPTMNAVILSPICPHSLTDRHLVIPANVTLEATQITDTSHVILTLDGQKGLPIKCMDKILVKKADDHIRLIHFAEKNHYEILKRKLHWGSR